MYSVTANIFPVVAPTITMRSDTTLVSTGGNTTISCTAEGFPAPNVTWYHNGTEIIDPVTTSTNGVVVSSSVLVSLAMANDSGQYTCNFTSPVSVYSVVTATIQVLVQGRIISDFLNEMFKICCCCFVVVVFSSNNRCARTSYKS